MDRWTGLIGLVGILGLAFLMSNNRKAINYRLVLSGLALQVLLALFILKTSIGQSLFNFLALNIKKILDMSDKAAYFVFGPLADYASLHSAFGVGAIFFFKIVPSIIFVAVLVKIFYHLRILQWFIKYFAKGVHYIMHVSGSEALSNVSSAFVGQVEAQLMIAPYVKGMTMSELLASMSGSMATIAGGVMAVFIGMGIPGNYLLAASIMAAPGALVISKIVWPETESSETKGEVKLEVKKQHANLMDAISAGASDGLRIALNVIAMLIGFLGIIYLLNAGLGKLGSFIGVPLSFEYIMGNIFQWFAWAMGVPTQDMQTAGQLMGTKFVVNEFVAYSQMQPLLSQLHPRTIAIVTFALCGFANFSSIAIQVGGIGQIAPERRNDLAKLGFKALICGTLASYLSATLAGLLL